MLYLADQLPATYIKTFDDKFCQAIACTCETSKTLILLIYRPPNADTQSTRKLFKFLKEYISEVNEDDADGYDIMLLGDFNLPNIQWPTTSLLNGFPNSTTDAAGTLLGFMDDFFLKQHIQAATRQSNILDLFLTNNDAMILDIAVEDTKLSDHRIIEVLLTDNPAYQHITTPKRFEENSFRCLDLPKADYTTVNEDLENIDWTQLRSLCTSDEEFPELFRLTLLQLCLL